MIKYTVFEKEELLDMLNGGSVSLLDDTGVVHIFLTEERFREITDGLDVEDLFERCDVEETPTNQKDEIPW